MNLLRIARLKSLASAAGISSVEINGPRLMLKRNQDYILLEGRKFPRLNERDPLRKVEEAIGMLRRL
jgi:hypothetical protein